MAEFFVRRPIVAMVISIIMVLLGLVPMSGLPIATARRLNIESPFAPIMTNLPSLQR